MSNQKKAAIVLQNKWNTTQKKGVSTVPLYPSGSSYWDTRNRMNLKNLSETAITTVYAYNPTNTVVRQYLNRLVGEFAAVVTWCDTAAIHMTTFFSRLIEKIIQSKTVWKTEIVPMCGLRKFL